jgi:transcriptional regulator with XRE-family HTH domain
MIYDLIRDERRALGLTLEELSSRTGIAASNLSRLEKGRVDARATTLSRVLRSLGLALTATRVSVSSLDEIKERMDEGAARLGSSGISQRDAPARLAWKEQRGLDTTVERRLLGIG